MAPKTKVVKAKTPVATTERQVVSEVDTLSPLDNLKVRIANRNSAAIAAKEEALIGSVHKPLYDYLKKSGTGQSKLKFLLNLEFVDAKGKEVTDQKKIADIAATAFAVQYPGNVLTGQKILEYGESLSGKQGDK